MENLGGRNRFSNQKPGIRYFSPSSDSPGCYAHDTNTDTYKTVSAFAIYGRVDEYTNVVLSADGLVESFEVADDEIDRMEGVINEPSAPRSSDSEDDEENEALRGTGGVRPKQICFVPMATSKYLQQVRSGCEADANRTLKTFGPG